MYSARNERKSAVAWRFIRILKNKSYKYMTSISKNVHIDKLDDMTPVDLKSNTYIDSSKEINKKDQKFKIGDIVRTLKYKSIFEKGYVPNWSEEVFVIKKVKSTVPWTYVISDLDGEEIVRTFYERELEKNNQKEFIVEKVIKRKDDKLYVKWKGYDSSFNNWINKRRHNIMSEYFSDPKSSWRRVKFELCLYNYATKADLKNVTVVDPLTFAEKVD